MAQGFHGNHQADSGNLPITVFLSLLLHAAVFAMLFLSPSFPSHKFTMGPVYNVSLVNFSAGPMAGGGSSASGRSNAPTLEKENRVPKKVETVVKRTAMKTAPLKIPAVPLAPIAKIEKTATSNTRNLALEKAIDNIRKRAAASGEIQKPSVDQSVSGRAAGDVRTGARPDGAAKTTTDGGNGLASAAGGAGEEGDPRVNAYYSEIWRRIKLQWALPGGMMPKNALESVVSITILRNGAVTDPKFEKTSGNLYFDESVMKAIQKANPLPPLPEWISGASLSIGIRFHSSELAY